jgi:hypothetical protein
MVLPSSCAQARLPLLGLQWRKCTRRPTVRQITLPTGPPTVADASSQFWGTSASDRNTEQQQAATIPALFLDSVMSSPPRLGAPGDVLVEPGARQGRGKLEQFGQPATIETDHPYGPRAAPVGRNGKGIDVSVAAANRVTITPVATALSVDCVPPPQATRSRRVVRTVSSHTIFLFSP